MRFTSPAGRCRKRTAGRPPPAGAGREPAASGPSSTPPRRRATASNSIPTTNSAPVEPRRCRLSPACRIWTIRAPKTNSFRAAPYRIMPRAGPLWSRTMTSWIIVSSRWVFGSSKGMREFSASRTMNQLTTTSTSAAPADGRPATSEPPKHPGQAQRAGEPGQHQQAEEERRLRQAGEGDLACGSHPLEGRAGVQCGSSREEAPQASR